MGSATVKTEAERRAFIAWLLSNSSPHAAAQSLALIADVLIEIRALVRALGSTEERA